MVPGDQVKIIINPRYQLEVINTRNGAFLRPGKQGRNTRGYTRTIVFGSIIRNSPDTGEMDLNIVDTFNKVISGTIPYAYIKTIQKIVPFENDVETSDPTRPGGKALGTKLPGNILLTPRFNLINIKF